MPSLRDALDEHCGFHDAVIESFQLLPEAAVARLGIDDVHANFRGLPGYEGERIPAELVVGFREMVLGVDMYGPGLTIYDCEIEANEDGETLIVKLAPSGTLRFAVRTFELIRARR